MSPKKCSWLTKYSEYSKEVVGDEKASLNKDLLLSLRVTDEKL